MPVAGRFGFLTKGAVVKTSSVALIAIAVLSLIGAAAYGASVLLPSGQTAGRGGDGTIELAQGTVPKPPVVPKKTGIPTVAPPAPVAPPPADAAAAAAPVPAAFSSRLREAGVSACLPQLDALGSRTMEGVTAFAPASNWNQSAPESHLVSIFLGQKYGNQSKLPFGFTGLFGAPDGRGKCDGISVQVLPSPVNCPDLQASILLKGKLLGNLAGLPFLQDVNSQVVLVPTAGPGCVLVAIHTEYAAN